MTIKKQGDAKPIEKIQKTNEDKEKIAVSKSPFNEETKECKEPKKSQN
jgi:hypothetical protein